MVWNRLASKGKEIAKKKGLKPGRVGNERHPVRRDLTTASGSQ